ncbi:MAG: hypothetical protein WAK14_05085 [Methanobacterium sp.]
MKSKRDELEDLEEQLVLLYRFVAQNNTLKKFYYEGVDVKPSFKDKTGILTELVNNEDSEEILMTCIMEIEESKKEIQDEENKVIQRKFHEVLNSYDIQTLYKKYGMSGVDDVDKLDINRIIEAL